MVAFKSLERKLNKTIQTPMLDRTIQSDFELVECHQTDLALTQGVAMVFVLLAVLVRLSLVSLELGRHR
jgi:hypothetical protein